MQTINPMQMVLLFGIFALVVGAVFGVMLFVAPRGLQRRIEQAGGVSVVPAQSNASATPGWVEKIATISEPISKLSIPKEGWESSPLRLRLLNAGWRSPAAASIYFGAKTVLAIALPLLALGLLSGTHWIANRQMLSAMLVLLGGIGYYLPTVVLARRVANRQQQIFEEFPDAIDLLTVCVEAGLGLDAALMKVAQEVALSSPVLASELELMLLELRSGFSKEKALRNLALRTGVEDVDAFASMLTQAERFGTSIAASLRVLSDTLRTRRRMRAEERAAKIALKLLFPLIFFLFPSLMTVLLGPAAINIYRVLLPMMSGVGG
jgi:tight adherence protein C